VRFALLSMFAVEGKVSALWPQTVDRWFVETDVVHTSLCGECRRCHLLLDGDHLLHEPSPKEKKVQEHCAGI